MSENTASSDMLLSFLREYDVAALSTIMPGNVAHGTAIYYYVDEDFNFYFLTKSETLKFKNIETNNSASLVVIDQETLQTVQVDGVAEEVDYKNEYASQLQMYNQTLARNRQEWHKVPLTHVPGSEWTFVKVTPKWMRWTDYKNWEHSIKFEHKFS